MPKMNESLVVTYLIAGIIKRNGGLNYNKCRLSSYRFNNCSTEFQRVRTVAMHSFGKGKAKVPDTEN